MYCIYCGVELLDEFPSIVCNECFKKVQISVNMEGRLTGCTGSIGHTGYSQIGYSPALSAAYYVYSERAGMDKKQLKKGKWRMIRLSKPKRLIRGEKRDES